MEITLTFRELMDLGAWTKFCEITGTNPWCINEGISMGDEEVTLNEEDARECGLI